MNFLNEVYFNNTLKSYLIVACTIVFAFLFKRYLSRYIAQLGFKLVHRIWTKVSESDFVNLVLGPLEWFLLVLISVFAIDKLNFPTAINFKLYGHSLDDVFARAGVGIIIIFFIQLVLMLVDFVALIMEQKADLTDEIRDNQLIVFSRDLLKVIIGVVGILLIIKACFNQPVGQLLTGLSIVGAALALATKESVENLIASFVIFFDKPFFTNDTVKVNNITGKVEKIGLRSTRIRTIDKTLITIPNKQMVDSIVDNWSMQTNRRVEIKLEIASNTTICKTEKLIEEAKKILADNNQHIVSSSVFFKELSKNGKTLIVEYFTEPFSIQEYDILKQIINLQIAKILESEAVAFAGETNTIVTNNDLKGN